MLKDFLKILGVVVFGFIGIFAFMYAFMFMVAGPTLMHVIIGTPIALIVLAGCIFGVAKIAGSEYS